MEACFVSAQFGKRMLRAKRLPRQILYMSIDGDEGGGLVGLCASGARGKMRQLTDQGRF